MTDRTAGSLGDLEMLRAELEALRSENARLAAENALLRALFASAPEPVPAPIMALKPAIASSSESIESTATPDGIGQHSSPEIKLALFRSLFAGRTDVYATPWTSTRTGKKGWSPAEVNPWSRRDDAEREFLPLTDEVIEQHLRGHHDPRHDTHIGLYPMLPDETCRLLAVDFDDADWQGDAAAFHAACTTASVPAAVEVSRSGEGAHVWIFFTAPVPASAARALGFALLRRAITASGQLSLDSYDRFFPSQDTLPIRAKGPYRLGNLIALPLQGTHRRAGTTLFCDPATWEPYPDQFAFLATLDRLTPADVEKLAEKLGPVRVGMAQGPEPARLPRGKRTSVAGRMPKTVKAKLAADLAIATKGLPAEILAALAHAASVHNPEFYRRQAQRFSTHGTPRFVRRYHLDDGWLHLPRGLRDQAAVLLTSAGARLTVKSTVTEPEHIDVKFTGELTDMQIAAVEAIRDHATGVLVAPPGSGKTVMACALLAHHAVPTAIVVNKAELLTQWRTRLHQFLDLDATAIGHLGGGKDKRTGIVALVILPSLAHRNAAEGLLDGYGLIIVDECHALGAPAAEAAIGRAQVARWIGLTATPFRADGMDDLITLQAGPVRHRIETDATFTQHLIIHPTDFSTTEPGTDGASI
jgi:hypothetical protein